MLTGICYVRCNTASTDSIRLTAYNKQPLFVAFHTCRMWSHQLVAKGAWGVLVGGLASLIVADS